jgi:hypothetical protein
MHWPSSVASNFRATTQQLRGADGIVREHGYLRIDSVQQRSEMVRNHGGALIVKHMLVPAGKSAM